MSKLLQGKKWLTIEDAITYLASEIGESVCESDIFDLVARDSLVLSVNIIERSYVEIGKVVDDVYELHIDSPPLKVLSGFWETVRLGYASGIWDIVNDAGSKQIFERKYYSTKEGYNGAQGTNRWIFIARENGRVCKLLEPESFHAYDGVSIKYDPASDFPNGFQFVVLKHRIDKLINELNSQEKLNDKVSSSSNAHPRTEESYKRLVGALLSIIDGTSPIQKYVNDAQLIKQLGNYYQGYEGFSKRGLEDRLPECRASLD